MLSYVDASGGDNGDSITALIDICLSLVFTLSRVISSTSLHYLMCAYSTVPSHRVKKIFCAYIGARSSGCSTDFITALVDIFMCLSLALPLSRLISPTTRQYGKLSSLILV